MAHLGEQAVLNVSIHASSREDATLSLIVPYSPQWFQSTRPRGRTRHTDTLPSAPDNRFNPRVLAGGRDAKRKEENFERDVSIHASSREDATTFLRIPVIKTMFQSTRPRGRTRPLRPWMFGICRSFNPRVLAGGRDLSRARMLLVTLCFNPRVLAGGRDGECRKQYKSKCYICKSAKEIILIINEEQYHFS